MTTQLIFSEAYKRIQSCIKELKNQGNNVEVEIKNLELLSCLQFKQDNKEILNIGDLLFVNDCGYMIYSKELSVDVEYMVYSIFEVKQQQLQSFTVKC